MAEIYWNPLVPELGVTDVDASLDFYCAAGFSVRFRREQPPFAYLELGGAQLMVEALHADAWTVGVLEPPFGRGVNLQVEVESARAVGGALVAAGFTLFRQLTEAWYDVDDGQEGQLEVLAQDPDGYLLRFVESLGRRPVGEV
jgi:catechol 2,3-dioxygenase-like lactoylglutathione lyase family enzyme